MITIRIDTSGWEKKFGRVTAEVRRFPKIRVIADGSMNKMKLALGINRGDALELSEDAATKCRRTIARQLGKVFRSTAEDMTPAANKVGDLMVEDAKDGIMEGRVTTPKSGERSDAWKKRKRQNINLLGLTGDLKDSLRRVFEWR